MDEFRTHEQRIRRKLRRMEHDDKDEAAKSTLEAIIRAARTRLNETHPDLPPEEIERRVQAMRERGLRPTTATVKSSPGIPADVLAARKVARKAEVAKRRSARRG